MYFVGVAILTKKEPITGWKLEAELDSKVVVAN